MLPLYELKFTRLVTLNPSARSSTFHLPSGIAFESLTSSARKFGPRNALRGSVPGRLAGIENVPYVSTPLVGYAPLVAGSGRSPDRLSLFVSRPETTLNGNGDRICR